MSDSSGDEEATVCPDDQSIDVGMDVLTLDNRSGGMSAVPTVSPVDAQPPDEGDLSTVKLSIDLPSVMVVGTRRSARLRDKARAVISMVVMSDEEADEKTPQAQN